MQLRNGPNGTTIVPLPTPGRADFYWCVACDTGMEYEAAKAHNCRGVCSA